MPAVIQRRLDKAIQLNQLTSPYYKHRRNPNKIKRGTYKRGVTKYDTHITLIFTKEQADLLKYWSAKLKLSRSIFLRDAWEMYAWMLEQEHLEAVGTWAPEHALRNPNYKKKLPRKVPGLRPAALDTPFVAKSGPSPEAEHSPENQP